MIDHPHVSCAVPPEWQAKLERLAAERHLTTSQIVSEAIAQYLGVPAQTTQTRLQQLETEMAVLRAVVADLHATLHRSQQPPFSPTNAPTPPPSSAPMVSQGQPLSYEDVEDEPDEVLYDFLEP